MERGIRIDKWLWAVRIFKTRSLASDACRSGKVKILDQAVKPSHEVKIDEVITVAQSPITKTVKVVAVIGNRVSAKLVPGAMEDLTPQEEYQKLKLMKEMNFEYRERGIGRPTKRERREIEFLKLYLDE
jgi:ribosome-associated heat shock protein Hsp15